MKWTRSYWLKIIIGIAIILFIFLPIIPVSVDVVAHKQVSEEYTTVEPYIVQKEVIEPHVVYQSQNSYEVSEAFKLWELGKGPMPTTGSGGHNVIKQVPITKTVTTTTAVTEYREVTKTRLVEKLVVET
jgi:hypothetical protein